MNKIFYFHSKSWKATVYFYMDSISQFGLAILQVLSSPMCLRATVLGSTGVEREVKTVLYGWAGCVLHKEVASKGAVFI